MLKSVIVKRIRNGYVVNLITATRGGNVVTDEWFEPTLGDVLAELQRRFGKKEE